MCRECACKLRTNNPIINCEYEDEDEDLNNDNQETEMVSKRPKRVSSNYVIKKTNLVICKSAIFKCNGQIANLFFLSYFLVFILRFSLENVNIKKSNAICDFWVFFVT